MRGGGEGCPPEPPAPLLVHLGPGRHAVYRHEEHLPRLDHPEQHLVVEVGEVAMVVAGVWEM